MRSGTPGNTNGTPDLIDNQGKSYKKQAGVPRSEKYGYGIKNSNIGLKTSYTYLSSLFFNNLEQMGYRHKTCRRKYFHLLEFLEYWCTAGLSQISEIDSSKISIYQHEHLKKRANKTFPNQLLSLKTQHMHLCSIRDFFQFMVQLGQLSSNPCSSLEWDYPSEKNSRDFLTQTEIKLLYNHCYNLQERAILSIAYGCGLRAGELAAVNCKDVLFNDQILIVPKGKGKKRRTIPMSPGVAADLSQYYNQVRPLLAQGNDYYRGLEAFLLNARGGRMKDYTANKYLKKILVRTQDEGILSKKIGLHSLRHSIASHLLEQGMAVDQVRLFLGHSQLETTQIYTHINAQQLQKLVP